MCMLSEQREVLKRQNKHYPEAFKTECIKDALDALNFTPLIFIYVPWYVKYQKIIVVEKMLCLETL